MDSSAHTSNYRLMTRSITNFKFMGWLDKFSFVSLIWGSLRSFVTSLACKLECSPCSILSVWRHTIPHLYYHVILFYWPVCSLCYYKFPFTIVIQDLLDSILLAYFLSLVLHHFSFTVIFPPREFHPLIPSWNIFHLGITLHSINQELLPIPL